MKKAVSITLIISLVGNLLYIVLSSVLKLIAPLAYSYIEPNAGSYILAFLPVFLNLLGLLVLMVFAFLIILSLKKESENIALEIVALIMSCGLFSIVPSLVNVACTSFVGRMFGANALASMSIGNSYSAYITPLHLIFNTLFIIGCTISICYKKNPKITFPE